MHILIGTVPAESMNSGLILFAFLVKPRFLASRTGYLSLFTDPLTLTLYELCLRYRILNGLVRK